MSDQKTHPFFQVMEPEDYDERMSYYESVVDSGNTPTAKETAGYLLTQLQFRNYALETALQAFELAVDSARWRLNEDVEVSPLMEEWLSMAEEILDQQRRSFPSQPGFERNADGSIRQPCPKCGEPFDKDLGCQCSKKTREVTK